MILGDLDALLPAWMVGTYRKTMAPLIGSVAATLDALSEAVIQARLGWLPGQTESQNASNAFDSFDALPLIARDRGFRQGFLESPFAFADRLRRWLEEWARSATPKELLDQVAAILSPDPPELIMVDSAGTWWHRQSNGIIFRFTAAGDGFAYQIDNLGIGSITAESFAAQAWDWDSASDPFPFGKGDDGRFWLIIRAPANGPYLAAISGVIGDGRYIGAGGIGPAAATIGTVAPYNFVELVRAIVLEWRAAGLKCSHIIAAFDPTSFKYDGSSALYPDGTWGWPCKDVMGVMTPARDLTARYWRAEPGGVAGTL